MAKIRFENVSKSFGDVQAVRDVSFEIPDNSFFCLFGPPSSGKSTILKLILGLEKPDRGEILFNDRPVKDIGAAQRNVAMVFQNLALFPHMTALENVRFPLIERKLDEDLIQKRVEYITEKLHMRHILHKPPAQLSGGERQRVAIARALVRDAVAYLMDDPIAALDARLREETRVELRRMQRDLSKTLVYVTHDQEEAMSVSDQMLILKDGYVQQSGMPSELYDHPNSTYVASMLGAPEMNFANVKQAADILALVPDLLDDADEIGVRPEHLKITRKHGHARITGVEPMGATTVLSILSAGTTWKASLPGQPKFELGNDVSVSVDPAAIHRFNKDGNSIGVVGGRG